MGSTCVKNREQVGLRGERQPRQEISIFHSVSYRKAEWGPQM